LGDTCRRSNAISGKWVSAPGDKLFHALEQSFPYLPIIAEDLGVITPDVVELRDKFGLPGMRVLHFAFAEGDGNLSCRITMYRIPLPTLEP